MAGRAIRDVRSSDLRRPLLLALPPLLGGAFGLQAFQLDRGMIRKRHSRGDGVMPGLFGDEPVHRLADTPICRMTLR